MLCSFTPTARYEVVFLWSRRSEHSSVCIGHWSKGTLNNSPWTHPEGLQGWPRGWWWGFNYLFTSNGFVLKWCQCQEVHLRTAYWIFTWTFSHLFRQLSSPGSRIFKHILPLYWNQQRKHCLTTRVSILWNRSHYNIVEANYVATFHGKLEDIEPLYFPCPLEFSPLLIDCKHSTHLVKCAWHWFLSDQPTKSYQLINPFKTMHEIWALLVTCKLMLNFNRVLRFCWNGPGTGDWPLFTRTNDNSIWQRVKLTCCDLNKICPAYSQFHCQTGLAGVNG